MSDVPRLLHITNAGGFGRVQLGGGERAVVDLTRHFAEEECWRVTVVAPKEFLAVAPLSPSLGRVEESFSWGAPRRLARVIAKCSPDIVVTHLLRATLVAQPIAALARVPARVSILHNSLYEIQMSTDSWRAASRVRGYRAAFHAITRSCTHATVAISASNEDDLISRDHLSRRFVRTIDNWVSPPFFDGAVPSRAAQLRDELGIGPRDLVVGFVGRIERQKNLEFLIRLIPGLPQARLIVVGSGSEEAGALRLAATLGVGDRVAFVGRKEDVPLWLGTMDVLAVPSLFEGFGRVAVEAMAVGVPVVGSAADGLKSVLERVGPPSAYVVPLSDPGRWLETLASAAELGRSSARRGRLRGFVASNFGLDRACMEYRRLYEDVLDKSAGPRRPALFHNAP